MNVAINGFGRIGRAAFKIIQERVEKGANINVVAINDLVPAETLAYLLKYDTVYGRYNHQVSFDEGNLIVDGKKYKHVMEKEAELLPWKDLDVDVVIECTGIFTNSADAQKHIQAGAKKVLLSAPSKDTGFETFVLGSGVDYNYSSNMVSNASCTTNCVTPVLSVLTKYFGIEKSLLTTAHAYTATQSLVDGPNKKDIRIGRAGAQNIVPESTGAAIAVARAMPAMQNLFDGIALRVPVACGSISDITALLKKNVTVEEVNSAFKQAETEETYQGILKYTEDPIVSSDIIKTSYSAIVDGLMTRVVGGNLVKVLAWYDNEWGYSNRLVDMALKIS